MAPEDYPGIWRYIIVIVSMVEVMCFTGVIFGWGALVYVLKEEGFLVELCDSDNRIAILASTTNDVSQNETNFGGIECDERDARFNLYFTLITSIGVLLILLCGHIFTKFGTRIVRIIFITTYGAGCLCIAQADTHYPWLICVGGILKAGSGYVYAITGTQFNQLFPKQSSTIVGLIIGMKISSTFMQQLVKLAHDNGISRRISYYFLLGLVSLTYLTTVFLFPRKMLLDNHGDSIELEIDPPVEASVDCTDETKKKEERNSYIDDEMQYTNMNHDDHDFESKESAYEIVKNHQSIDIGSIKMQISCVSDTIKTFGGTPDQNLNVVKRNKTEHKEEKMSKYICTYLYFIHVLWFTVIMFRINYFPGTINPFIEQATNNDQAKVSHYTDALSYTMAGAIVACVIIGMLYDWQKRFFIHIADTRQRRLLSSVCPLIAVNVTTVILCSLVFYREESVLYPVFIMFTLLRSTFSTISNTFLVDMFPGSVYGSLYGIRFVIGNTFSLIQYALFEWSLAYEGAELHVNIFVLCLCMTTFVCPLSILLTVRRENNVKVGVDVDSL